MLHLTLYPEVIPNTALINACYFGLIGQKVNDEKIKNTFSHWDELLPTPNYQKPKPSHLGIWTQIINYWASTWQTCFWNNVKINLSSTIRNFFALRLVDIGMKERGVQLTGSQCWKLGKAAAGKT